jgi:hypothetical protein
MHPPRFLLPYLLAFAAPLSAEVHTVGPVGSGADFETIQAAVDAAAPGDVVQVAPGTYAPFSLEKPLLVIGAGSGQTRLHAPGLSATAVFATGLAAGEVAVVASMDFEASEDSAVGGGLQMQTIAGTVVLHDLRSLAERFAELRVDAVNRLVGSRLALTSTGDSHPTLRVVDSRAWMVDCLFAKSEVYQTGWASAVSTVRLFASAGSLAGCTVVGPDVDPSWSFFGGTALELKAATAVAARTTLLGGDGAGTGAGGFGGLLSQGAALFAGAATALQGGLDGAGLVEQQPVSVEPGSAFVQGAAALPTLSAAPALVRAGDVLALELHGPPGASGALFASLAPGAGASLPGVQGEAFLDLAAPILLGAVVLDAAGTAQVALPVPALAEPTLATFQWATVTGAGVELSNPAFAGVR